MAPIIHFPRHPLRLARFGIPAAAPATAARPQLEHAAGEGAVRRGRRARVRPLSRPMSSSVGCALIDACHAFGWPVAKGGSRTITDALAAESCASTAGRSRRAGGSPRSRELGTPDVVVFDLAPGAVAEIAGDRLPRAGRSRLPALPARARARSSSTSRWRAACPGPTRTAAGRGRFTWSAPSRRSSRRSASVNRGRDAGAAIRPGRPAVPGRPDPLQWATSIRSGSTRTFRAATAATRPSRCWGRSSASPRASASGSSTTAIRTPADLEAYNANYVGGDIITGANTPVQVLIRPRLALDPYSTGIDGVYICSAATPPGAGAHGMNGYNAARSALRHLG